MANGDKGSKRVIYMSEGMISTRRLARILVLLGTLLAKVGTLQQAPFLMGSLYQLGGLLKIEVRNYLQTKSKYVDNFRIVCPLSEASKMAEDSI